MAEKKERDIKHGEYRLAAGASMADILARTDRGQSDRLHSSTYPRGLTSWQVVEKLKTADLLEGDIDAVPAEGTLLPDTYDYRPRRHAPVGARPRWRGAQ